MCTCGYGLRHRALATCFPRSSTAGSCIVHAAAAVCVPVHGKGTLNYGGIDGTLPATGALDISVGSGTRASPCAPDRSPCSVQEFEGPSCAPKRSQRQHVNERVWLAALVTGHWWLPRAGYGGWMAESLDGHLQMRCLFSLLLGDGNVNTNSISHQRPSPGHRGERSPRRNLFFAGPLSCFHLPSPSRPKALQHPSPSPSPIDRRGTPPSGGAILLHIPQLPSLFPHTSHPVRPTVLPFHPPSPTRCPASSVHCPLRCPLKTACWPRIEDGASGLLPDRETRSDLLASRRNEAPSCVFPFCISHHAVLSSTY